MRLVWRATAGGFFYLVLTPLAMMLKLVGRDRLRLRFEPSKITYWIISRPAPHGGALRKEGGPLTTSSLRRATKFNEDSRHFSFLSRQRGRPDR